MRPRLSRMNAGGARSADGKADAEEPMGGWVR